MNRVIDFASVAGGGRNKVEIERQVGLSAGLSLVSDTVGTPPGARDELRFVPISAEQCAGPPKWWPLDERLETIVSARP